MVFDMGLTGLGILAALALGFGALAQVITWRSGTRWMWLVAAVGWFIGGLFVSEVMFATYAEAEIQPIIDGLAFDEALLGGLVVGLAVALATWFVTRQFRRESTSA
jgi:hypothetical protein